jgi:diguanylate cyclase (GGDEF)-like protein
MRWPWRRFRRHDALAASAGDGEVSKREQFYLTAIFSLLDLLKGAFSAVRASPEDQTRGNNTIDELMVQFKESGGADQKTLAGLGSRLRKESDRLSEYLSRQRNASDAREKELKRVVSLLTRSVTEASDENATFYEDIRAEGELIARASKVDDLQKLQSLLRVASQKLAALVDDKESHEQSRVDTLASEVEELREELRAVRATAKKDGLTGCLNRRSFDKAISELVGRYQGTRKRFSLLIFDIDNFKHVNDSYGHQVGDRVLIAFAECCQSLLRSDDRLARFGGEEFAVLLDGVSLRNAMKRATGICEAVASSSYAVEKEGAPGHFAVTVSVGVAELRRTDNVETIIKRADDALYRAKAQGKNRAVSEAGLDA